MKEVISEPDVLILDAGSRFLIDEATSRTNCDDIEDIKCMEPYGPEELVAEAKGMYF